MSRTGTQADLSARQGFNADALAHLAAEHDRIKQTALDWKLQRLGLAALFGIDETGAFKVEEPGLREARPNRAALPVPLRDAMPPIPMSSASP